LILFNNEPALGNTAAAIALLGPFGRLRNVYLPVTSRIEGEILFYNIIMIMMIDMDMTMMMYDDGHDMTMIMNVDKCMI
jgi:hypothetical protein